MEKGLLQLWLCCQLLFAGGFLSDSEEKQNHLATRSEASLSLCLEVCELLQERQLVEAERANN